jgi:hypothetical protein
MEKKTFAAVKAEEDARRHNSNLANLGNALCMIKEKRDRLKAELESLAEIEAEIEEAGASDNLTVDRTRALYSKALGLKS